MASEEDISIADCEECGYPTPVFMLVQCDQCGVMLCDFCAFEHECDGADDDDGDFERPDEWRDPDEEREMLATWNQTVRESWPDAGERA